MLEFEHSQSQLKQIAKQVLDKALTLGASDAKIEINESIETGVDVLNSLVENFETSYSSSISLTVYKNEHHASVSLSNINLNQIENAIKKALELANHTQADPYNRLPDKEHLIQELNKELGLFNPTEITNKELINKALEIEKLGLNQHKLVDTSDGASVGIGKYNFILANTNGLLQGYQTTRYQSSLSLIGHNNNEMQTDYSSSSARDINDLLNNQVLADIAASRTLRRLHRGKKIKSGKYPVIFENRIAQGLIGALLGAIGGNNIYRKLSFLHDKLDQHILPSWFNIYEDPFVYKGIASCYFDGEGVNVQQSNIIKNGYVDHILLDSYYARKLNLQSTGNSGGTHNLLVNANFKGDIANIAKTIKNGLVVIETIGHGLNMATGDYSVGASGLWIENGEITDFIDNLTISGNLNEMFKNIQIISDDIILNSSIQCGSMLIDGINIAS